MIERKLFAHLKQLEQWYPIIAITGPRQSGKTTLSKAAFSDFKYFNLEDRNLRIEAIEDPMGFIRNRGTKLIIDEAQLAPDLFSSIQVVSDEVDRPGQYVLSGSQNFLLAKNIKQSLAGRCAYVNLLPLSFSELSNSGRSCDIWNFAFTGGYPRIYNSGIPSDVYYQMYLDTYVERDVKEYLDVRNVKDFDVLLRILAAQSSKLLNISALSNACNISSNTTKSWISILEGSFVVFKLYPYSANIKKRLTKTPKIYFYDTGLLCYLLGINSAEELKLSEYKGAVIENLVISETIKKYSNFGKRPELYFYRDDSKVEIDLLDFTNHSDKKAFEIKSGGLFHDKYAKNLISTAGTFGVTSSNQTVLLDVDNNFLAKSVNVGSITQYLLNS